MPKKKNERYRAILRLMEAQDMDRRALADVLGLTYAQIRDRFLGITDWRVTEMFALCDCLGIADSEIPNYFRGTPRTAVQKRCGRPPLASQRETIGA